MKSEHEVRAAWLTHLFSTAPADRARAEQAVRSLYAAAGFAEPKHFLWFDSPFAASWAVGAVAERYDRSWAQLFKAHAQARDVKQKADETRSVLGSRLGVTGWDAVLAAIGTPLAASLQYPPDPSRILSTRFIDARFGLVDDVADLFQVRGDDDDLQRAEDHYWGSNRGALNSALHCPTTEPMLGRSFCSEYSFSAMADDEHRVGDREPPAIMSAAWDVARSSGLWWPFQNAAILSDRPSELHVNERHLLHRGDGPAVVFRDGWVAYAWNGKAVPERWIMQPESVPPKEFKGFDPTFQKYVESRVGKTTTKAPKRAKPAAILKTALPEDPADRLEQLRSHAGGRLPFFDRYQAGDHRQVWRELVALGADVRADPNAADALAVAYESMRRVEANVRTLVQRLEAMGYVFSQSRGRTIRPHVPPEPEVRKAIVDLEKDVGALPLSLRAFYEVVGEVNLIGLHPSLAPKDGTVATDPLVVYGIDEGAVEFDDEDGDTPSAITIAPDDLHKANTSGGDAYEMAIPDLRADGELLNERHGLFFVDYLRLCFGFGGFPGYDGIEKVPSEIAMLREGLIEF